MEVYAPKYNNRIIYKITRWKNDNGKFLVLAFFQALNEIHFNCIFNEKDLKIYYNLYCLCMCLYLQYILYNSRKELNYNLNN